MLDRVPRLTTRIVIYDAGKGSRTSAVATLRALGYTAVSQLAGGLEAGAARARELFRDVNSASKAFGELVELSSATHRRLRPRSSRRCSTRTRTSSCSTPAARTSSRR